MKSVRGRKDEKNSLKLRGDNRGMSLLELIIAVAIFSIAATSLLQAFVTSGRINNKSNLYLEATTTAQNVMEEIKAKSFTDVAAAFNYAIAADQSCRFSFLNTESQIDRIKSNETTIQEVLKNTSSDGDVYSKVSLYSGDESTVTASVISTDDGYSYTLNPRTKGSNASKYYFEMTGVKCLNETFDVLVEFDGSSSTSYKKSSVTDEDGKNDYEMPNIAKLNSKENGFLIRSEDWGMKVVKSWQQANPTLNEFVTAGKTGEEEEKMLEEVLAQVERTLTIRIREEGGTVTAEAQEHFEYTTKDNSGKKVVLCSDHSESNVDHTSSGYADNYTAFFSTEVGNTLEGLYIFYYPNYNSTSSTAPLDNIIFDNTLGKDVSLYVIKQKVDGADKFTDEQTTKYSNLENKYRMSLTVKEIPTKSNWKTNLSLYRAQTVLKTNLNYDIYASSRTEVKNQMTLTYQAMKSDGSQGQSETRNAGDVLSLNDLDDKEASDRIYTVKVSVYKEGAADDNFPEEDLVATLDGAKED